MVEGPQLGARDGEVGYGELRVYLEHADGHCLDVCGLVADGAEGEGGG